MAARQIHLDHGWGGMEALLGGLIWVGIAGLLAGDSPLGVDSPLGMVFLNIAEVCAAIGLPIASSPSSSAA